MRQSIGILAMVIGMLLLVVAAGMESTRRAHAYGAERARPSIHNNAAKCSRHCHNAGLRVTSWDGAYPARHTNHGCRCGE